MTSLKTAKSGFKIKLSNETVQKLQDDEALKVQESDNLKDNQSPVPNLDKEDVQIQKNEGNSNLTTESKKDSRNEEKPLEPENTKKIVSDKKVDGKNDWGEYSKYVTYEGDVAVYKEPNTNIEYTWSNDSNDWIPRTVTSNSESDQRVYSYENDTHIYTESDGSKFFWDNEKNAWIPKVDDDFLAMYQLNYGFIDNTTKESKEEAKTNVSKPEEKETQNPLKRKAPEPPKWFEPTADTNTKVYVSNLPQDITEEEFIEFMQKCGLVMRDPSNQKMKVKLYKDLENNCLKGDALCTYIKIESVELALKLLDGGDFKGNKIKVERAQFQMKGEYNPTLKPKKKKKKELEKIKRMQEKLFDWRPEKILGEKGKNERVVIVKNFFQPSDFDKDVQLILDYQQDLREECNKCGEVRKVVLYDRHPEGVAQITMAEPEQADAVIALINGRWFGKRQIEAHIWDGRTKYKIAETEADINKRIGNWEKFLEDDVKVKQNTADKDATESTSTKDDAIEKTGENKDEKQTTV